MTPTTFLPVIDLRAASASAQLRRAALESGFFYIIGHGVDERLKRELMRASRAFFAREPSDKLKIRMELGGRAWRGYFPVGAELTSGIADQKEGLYFGAELDESHPKVRAKTPLHGRNLFPEDSDLRAIVLDYMDAMTALGRRVMETMALSLGLEVHFFSRLYTEEPLILFRIFNYPSLAGRSPSAWSVGEHTDYGLLTMLLQDDSGGLEVKSPTGWIEAPPVPSSFVCNIGDMLERMTGGLYRSTPHRVRNVGSRDRLSFPFFFDPNWDAKIGALHNIDTSRVAENNAAARSDGTSVHAFDGTYGDYIISKVSHVFPELRRDVL